MDDLFRNGQGDEAHRLVLTSAHGRDLGGWGRQDVVDRIADALSRVQPERTQPSASVNAQVRKALLDAAWACRMQLKSVVPQCVNWKQLNADLDAAFEAFKEAGSR